MPFTIFLGNELTEKDLIDYGFDHHLMQYKIQDQIQYIIVSDPPKEKFKNIMDTELWTFFQTLHPYVYDCSEWKIVNFRNEKKFVFIVWI